MRKRLWAAFAASAITALIVACGSSSDESGSSSGSSGSSGSTSGGPDSSVGPGAEGGPGSEGGMTTEGGVTDGGSEASLEASVDAGPPAVQYIGRFDTTTTGGPTVAYPAARIIANFTGTDVSANLADFVLYNPEYGGNRWQVLVDGTATQIIQLDRTVTNKVYSLATGLTNGNHTIELYKLTEGAVGKTQFLGFDFGVGTLLPPPIPLSRHIQFLGDSASNGYGIQGTAPCSFTAATQNESLAFTALTAKALTADHHTIAISGKGVYQNYDQIDDSETFPLLYPHIGVAVGTALWDATRYVPDVVWMTLGANDYDGDTATPMLPPAGAFQMAYDALVTNVRGLYPNAHIFCAVSPDVSDAYPTGYMAYTNVSTALKAVVAAHADAKIHYFEFTPSNANGSDNTGCDGHPNVAKEASMAVEATAAIKTAVGW